MQERESSYRRPTWASALPSPSGDRDVKYALQKNVRLRNTVGIKKWVAMPSVCARDSRGPPSRWSRRLKHLSCA